MYEIRIFKNNQVVGFETSFESPSQDLLDSLVKQLGADFADVCREDDNN